MLCHSSLDHTELQTGAEKCKTHKKCCPSVFICSVTVPKGSGCSVQCWEQISGEPQGGQPQHTDASLVPRSLCISCFPFLMLVSHSLCISNFRFLMLQTILCSSLLQWGQSLRGTLLSVITFPREMCSLLEGYEDLSSNFPS